MAINIFDANAFSKLVEMEGAEWLRQQQEALAHAANDARVPHENSFVGAVMQLAEHGDTVIIYGLHGWHRYSVGMDGEIWFLRYFCVNAADVEKARVVGFNIG